MRFALLFVVVVVSSSCGTKLPPVPQHFQTTYVEDSFFSVPYYEGPAEKEYTVDQYLKQNPVCVNLDDYKKLKKYAGDVLQIIKKSCPNLVK